MNEEKIKELLAVSFVRLIAERAGFVVTRPSEDYGDDLLIMQISKTKPKQKLEYLTSGKIIGVQIKCTTEKGIKYKGGSLLFDLDRRTNDHLVYRRKLWEEERNTPLVLILFVLPDDTSNWLVLDEKSGTLTVHGKGYWFNPSDEMKFSKNKTQQRIALETKNQVNLSCFQSLFSLFYQNSLDV